jgi:magnesium transporter
MLKYYVSENHSGAIEIPEITHGCWVNAVNPTEAEIAMLEEDYGINRDFIKAPLDEEETARVDSDKGQTLIIIDSPIARTKEDSDGVRIYYTMPLGFILSKDFVITVSLKENEVISEFTGGVIKDTTTAFKTRFVFDVLMRLSVKYLMYLKQIDRMSTNIDDSLRQNMKNSDLFQLMELSKSLVYFSISLKSIKAVLDKILRGSHVRLYEDDRELLDDVSVEFAQAAEMSETYVNIITRNTDSFSNIINNNLNAVMKLLTIITIVLAVPSIVFSFYGMNVDLPLPNVGYAFGISVGLSLIAALILTKTIK